MSAIDALLEHNRRYTAGFRDSIPSARPSRGLALVTCMDARVMPTEALGLGPGEAHVIRNAGGIVNDETLRSLILSTHVLGVREVAVINHTDCGLLGVTDEALLQRLREALRRPVDPIPFYAFDDLEENVRRQVEKVRSAPLLPDGLTVRGFVYDVHSGLLSEVATPG